MKKYNTWNIRRLVDELFVPATHRIVLKIVKFLVRGSNSLGLSAYLGAVHKLCRLKIGNF